MSIDFITKGTMPDETKQSHELHDRVVNSAWILYQNLIGELDETLTQLGMELDENNTMQKKAKANDELIGIIYCYTIASRIADLRNLLSLFLFILYLFFIFLLYLFLIVLYY